MCCGRVAVAMDPKGYWSLAEADGWFITRLFGHVGAGGSHQVISGVDPTTVAAPAPIVATAASSSAAAILERCKVLLTIEPAVPHVSKVPSNVFPAPAVDTDDHGHDHAAPAPITSPFPPRIGAAAASSAGAESGSGSPSHLIGLGLSAPPTRPPMLARGATTLGLTRPFEPPKLRRAFSIGETTPEAAPAHSTGPTQVRSWSGAGEGGVVWVWACSVEVV